jgi:two-component system sensor kinase FixL
MSSAGEDFDRQPSPAGASFAEKEVQALLDAAVDAVIVIDDRGCIMQFSLAAQRMFGFASHEVAGRNVSMLMPEPYRSAHDGYMQRYMDTGEERIIGIGREVRARRKDGTEFPCDLAVGRIKDTDPPRFVGFIRDITERRRTEDESRAMRERLTQFSRFSTMGEMAAGLAHEINQPLAAIATYAQACQRLLAQPAPDMSDVVDALEQINLQALRAGEVIRRLRDFVRNREVKRETIDCHRLLEELRPLAATDARHHDVRLRIDCVADLPEVQADSIQLQQVLLNLVRNAIDAVSGEPRERREVTITAARGAEGDVEFAVLDRGPGLTPESVERLFTPFFTTKAGGTGLGLAISRSIVRAHGGRLWHAPNEGGGARFHFTLPVAPAETGDTQ